MRASGDAERRYSGGALSRRERGAHEGGSLCFLLKTKGLQADFKRHGWLRIRESG